MISELKSFFNKPDFGLLLLRACLGVIMAIHGVPKFLGGRAALEKVGSAIQVYGIDQMPLVWGFLAATAEVAGGIFLVLGLFFRPTTFVLGLVLLTATLLHYQPGMSVDHFNGQFSHPLTVLVVLAGLLFIGPGKYSVDGGSGGGGGGGSRKVRASE